MNCTHGASITAVKFRSIKKTSESAVPHIDCAGLFVSEVFIQTSDAGACRLVQPFSHAHQLFIQVGMTRKMNTIVITTMKTMKMIMNMRP